MADIDTDIDNAKLTVRFMHLPVFIKHINIKKIKAALNNEHYLQKDDAPEVGVEKGDKKEFKSEGKLKRFLIAFAWRMFGRIRLRALDCNAIIGTGDAATSAMIAGTVKITLLQACAFFGFDDKNIDITPEYYTERLFLDFFGIISFCFADIIFAVCGAITDTLRRRTWKRSYYENTVTE